MRVVDRKRIPIYSLICKECGSEIEFMRSEVINAGITCPICKMRNRAVPNTPKRMAVNFIHE